MKKTKRTRTLQARFIPFPRLLPLSYRNIRTQIRTFIRKFTNTATNLHSANKSSARVRWFSRRSSPRTFYSLFLSHAAFLSSRFFCIPVRTVPLLFSSTSFQFQTVPLHIRMLRELHPPLCLSPTLLTHPRCSESHGYGTHLACMCERGQVVHETQARHQTLREHHPTGLAGTTVISRKTSLIIFFSLARCFTLTRFR